MSKDFFFQQFKIILLKKYEKMMETLNRRAIEL